jgi:hypothetical protein
MNRPTKSLLSLTLTVAFGAFLTVWRGYLPSAAAWRLGASDRGPEARGALSRLRGLYRDGCPSRRFRNAIGADALRKTATYCQSVRSWTREMTFAEWDACVAAGGYKYAPEGDEADRRRSRPGAGTAHPFSDRTEHVLASAAMLAPLENASNARTRSLYTACPRRLRHLTRIAISSKRDAGCVSRRPSFVPD